MPTALLSGIGASVLLWLPEARLDWLPLKHATELEQQLGCPGPPPWRHLWPHIQPVWRAPCLLLTWAGLAREQKGPEARSGCQGPFILDGRTLAGCTRCHQPRQHVPIHPRLAHEARTSSLKPDSQYSRRPGMLPEGLGPRGVSGSVCTQSGVSGAPFIPWGCSPCPYLC